MPKARFNINTNKQIAAIMILPFKGQNNYVVWQQDFQGNILQRISSEHFALEPDYGIDLPDHVITIIAQRERMAENGQFYAPVPQQFIVDKRTLNGRRWWQGRFKQDREPFDVELILRKTSRIAETRVLETTVWKRRNCTL